MAGSWGTKVEAAFNQSPLLAGCPEELAEERMGAAAGEKVQRGLQGATKGLPAANWGTQCLPPHRTLLCRTPKKRHRECTCLSSPKAVLESCQDSFNPLQETSPKIKSPACTHLSLWGTLFAHQDGDTGAILRLRLLKALGRGVCREPGGT